VTYLYLKPMPKLNTLSEQVQDELKSLATKAQVVLRRRVESNAAEISRLYENDHTDQEGLIIKRIEEMGGASIGDAYDPESVLWQDMASGNTGTLANLFISRLLTVVSSLVPGTPTLEVVPRTAGAARMADNQNTISEFATDHGGLETAMARAALIGMLQPYFGVVLETRKATHPVDRVHFKALEADKCGYEPFLNRFQWRVDICEWGALPQDLQERFMEDRAEHEEPAAWTVMELIEVYHQGFRHGLEGLRDQDTNLTPVSYWLHPIEDAKAYGRRKTLFWGTYCGTRVLPDNPLHIDAFLQPAPNEACGPAEVSSWIPPMQQITSLLQSIRHFHETHNNITLFEGGAIQRGQIQQIIDTMGGRRVFIEVQPDDSTRGVNATMRPVELDSILSEMLSTLQLLIQLFDDVSGVSPMDRGMAQNPEKSATEASAITQNSSRRNKARLEVISRAFGRLARVHHRFQRGIYGKEIDLPTGSGLAQKIVVPDPNFASFAFRVDPVDLEHISRRGQIESHLTFMREATQTLANFRGAIPPVVRELLRRAGRALGFVDIDMYLQQPSTDLGPQERLIDFLMQGEPDAPLNTFPTDDSELFMAYYQNMLEDEHMVRRMDPALVERLMEAVVYYQQQGNRAQAAQLARQADGSRQELDLSAVAGPAAGPAVPPTMGPRVA